MSVYGGFATRQQENTYNSMIKALIELLSIKALKNLDGGNSFSCIIYDLITTILIKASIKTTFRCIKSI